MNHKEARLLIGADPNSVPPELAEHLAGCPECAQFQREMIGLDGHIRRALEHAPLSAAPGSVTPITSAPAVRGRSLKSVWSGWALAASIATLSVLAIWAFRPNDTLAQDVVAHVEHEPLSWSSTQQAPASEVNATLAEAGVALDMSSDKIMYAQNCRFRGHDVPHLVVSTPRGRMTVLILRYEKVKRRMSFHEDGMTGVITPAPHGSIAVLAQGDDNIDAVAAQVEQSVRWLP
jgi:Protein of unknown function (DUF3379)